MPQKQRRRAGLHFDDVEAVKVLGLTTANADAVLSLLAITFKANDETAGHITLHFAAGPQIKLTVAAINANLADLGGTWTAGQVPAHKA
jgi:hypothetical protein